MFGEFRRLLHQLIMMSHTTHANQRLIMAKLSDVQAAEDAEGAAIANAVAQNAANLQKIADLIAAGADPVALDALVTEANAHAKTLTDAFPAPDAAA